ncbi:Retrotransposable element Tf2 [Sesbania bispinosa]|nr:Retrotransposable element Tf2 [Sesbania bispinosa]
MCRGAPDSQYIPLPLTTTVQGPQFQPLAVLDTRRIQICDMWPPQILIQWEGTGDCTWEFVSHIHDQFPLFDLANKVTLDEEGDVMMKNTCGETSRGHVAIDPGKDEMVHKFVRRRSRIKKIPSRLRD